MFFYGTPAVDTSTPLVRHESENRRIAEFTFPTSMPRERKSKLRSAHTSSSLVALTGSPNSIISLSDFPMPPATIPSKRRKLRQRAPPVLAPVKPLHIIKRNPEIIPQTSPETSLTASLVPLSDEDEDACLANVLSELKVLEEATSNKARQRTCDNQGATPIILVVREASYSTEPVQPDSSKPVLSIHEDARMSDIILTPVAGTTAPPSCSTLGPCNFDSVGFCESNKENIDPNGTVVWPRPVSSSDKALNPLLPATNNMHVHGSIRTHSSCPLIPDLVSTPLPPSSSATRLSSIKSIKSRRKTNRTALPSGTTCRKNLVSPTTKARHRGNVVLENYIYPPKSIRASSPTLSSSTSSCSYPDFSMQSETSLRSQSIFGDMTLVGADSSYSSKLSMSSPSTLSCVSMNTDSSGDHWYDVLNLTAYMEG